MGRRSILPPAHQKGTKSIYGPSISSFIFGAHLLYSIYIPSSQLLGFLLAGLLTYVWRIHTAKVVVNEDIAAGLG